MIPFPFCNRPNVSKISILLNLSLLFFYFFITSSSSSLQINHSSHLNRSTIAIHPNPSPMPANQQKKLRRLPHVFSQVLELPLRSHHDVFIEDRSDCFRFVAKIEDDAFSGEVRAYAVKIHPGVTKIVVRGGNGGGEVELLLDKLEVDVWRFRLPVMARPELATAVVIGRELVVTVPKGGRSSRASVGEDGKEVRGGGRGWYVSRYYQ